MKYHFNFIYEDIFLHRERNYLYVYEVIEGCVNVIFESEIT